MYHYNDIRALLLGNGTFSNTYDIHNFIYFNKLKSPKWIQKNDISYGVYIYAWPIQVIISYIYITYSIPKNIGSYMIICMMLVAGFSTLSWFLIEKPILTKVR